MKIKIFRVISPLPGGKKGTLTFPPLGLGIVFRHLCDCGFDIKPDDLHVRWHREVTVSENKKLQELADDDERMWRYLEGNDDEGWEWFMEKATKLLDFEEPDILLFSMISGDPQTCRTALTLAHYLKKKFNKTIILGGEYFAYAPIYYVIERVLSLNVIDYYFIGYAEEPLGELLKIILEDGERDTLKSLPGLCYRQGEQVHKNLPYNLDHPVIPPDFTGMPMDLYRWSTEYTPPDPTLPRPANELTLPFHISTGCPYNCSFCECSGMKKVGILSPERAVQELQSLSDRFSCRTFFVLDDTINLSHRHLNELCDRIIDAELDIQWTACGSARNMDATMLAKMRQAGVFRIVWGLETGSERLNEFVNKPCSVEQISKVLILAHKAGIWNGVDVVVGMPTETDAEFQETLDFIKSHADVLDEVYTYGFYLNTVSDMLQNPTRYGIANVQPVNRNITRDAHTGATAAAYIFDEKDGLSWLEKEGQIKYRRGLMSELVARLGLYPMVWEQEQQPNLLSWCYRHCDNKEDVRRLYRAYWEKLVVRRTWETAGIRFDTVDEVAEEIVRRFSHPTNKLLEFDSFWIELYPDKYLSFYPELDGNLNYENSLLIDGRFHDMLVYTRAREKIN